MAGVPKLAPKQILSGIWLATLLWQGSGWEKQGLLLTEVLLSCKGGQSGILILHNSPVHLLASLFFHMLNTEIWNTKYSLALVFWSRIKMSQWQEQNSEHSFPHQPSYGVQGTFLKSIYWYVLGERISVWLSCYCYLKAGYFSGWHIWCQTSLLELTSTWEPSNERGCTSQWLIGILSFNY